MPDHDIIVVGASAGGIEALIQLAKGLPEDLPAALFVVVHIPASATSVLPQILSRSGKLQASHAKDQEEISRGHIYIAPPDRHLLIRQGRMRVVAGPRENGHRPAVDPLFRSAARHYRSRVTGVILSGALDDGTSGLAAIKSLGGTAVVQDPEEALYPGMPRSAIENVSVDYVVSVSQIGPLLAEIAGRPDTEAENPIEEELEMEDRIDELDPDAMNDPRRPGVPSGFGCPDCGGALWELTSENILRFRCRVGHAWTAGSLLDRNNLALEGALWNALRVLEERAALSDRLASNARTGGRPYSATHFEESAHDARQQAEVIRMVLLQAAEVARELAQSDPR